MDKTASKKKTMKKQVATEEDHLQDDFMDFQNIESPKKTSSPKPAETKHDTNVNQSTVTMPPAGSPPASNSPKLQIFYSNGFHSELHFKPHAIIIAQSQAEAARLLSEEIYKKTSNNTKLNPGIISQFSLQTPGVYIMSIGLGELERRNPSYESPPFTMQCKTQAEKPTDCKLFYCNTHYTSGSTPAASVILANDSNEAALFLMQMLVDIGVKSDENKDMIIKPIDSSKPGVYILTNIMYTEDTDFSYVQSTRVSKRAIGYDEEEPAYDYNHGSTSYGTFNSFGEVSIY